MSHTKVKKLIAAARVAQFGFSRTPDGLDTPTWHARKHAAVGGTLNLTTGTLSSLFDKDGQLTRTPHATISANTAKLSAGILKASRVAAVGAHVLVLPDNRTAIPTGRTGDVTFQRVPQKFRTISAPSFGGVIDDEELTTTPYPILSAEIDWEQSASLGLRFDLSRNEQRELPEDLLSAEIIAAVTSGIARAADSMLLTYIAIGPPSAFTLGKAAAQGLKIGEVAALVGTAGNGATMAADGTLRAAGIRAELTNDMAITIVGAWDRAAVAVRDNVDLHFERLDLKGNLAVTAWINVYPLVPDTSVFWAVSA